MNNGRLSVAYYKLRHPVRNQTEFTMNCLDDLIPSDHKARLIWDFVEEMDTSITLEYIDSLYGSAGRPATHPKIMLALWIYTILDGNSSARKLEELCKNHNVYKWICGTVSVNRTSIAEFRSLNPRKFDELLTDCLAVLVKSDFIKDTDFSQDGTRVKANAGFSSFHREKTISKLKIEISEYIVQLDKQQKEASNSYEKKEIAKKQHAAKEKKSRIEAALENLEEARCTRLRNGKRNNDIPSEDELKNVRASTTDPEVRKMKMGDGGFRLAYNIQFATGLDSRVIYGVDVVKTLDPGTAPILMNQVQERNKILGLGAIKNWIADAAYSGKNDVITVNLLFPNCNYFAPPKPNKGIDPKKPVKGDCEAIKKWRESIDTPETKTIYKKRCSTAEFSNMHAKNQALDSFSVRGLVKARGMAILHAIAQNCSRYLDLWSKKKKEVMV